MAYWRRRMCIEDYFVAAKNEAFYSNCLRRHVGAIIVKKGNIIGKGTNKVPDQMRSCGETGGCIRTLYNFPRGVGYNFCNSVHAEINAINSATEDVENSTMYLVGYDALTGAAVENLDCCENCKKAIRISGINIVCIKDVVDNQFIKVYTKDWRRIVITKK